ncbi:MAG TPA: imelysin family protein [Polyangiaceae bacterium]|nr:imelysin family protein [Polyangiaceae bacterium]
MLWLGRGCAPVPLTDGERRVALQQTTEQVILPTHAELSERAGDLAALLTELDSEPASADLGALRQAYLDVREPLQESRAFGFGPATELHSDAALDQAPIDPVKIDQELSGEAELTPAHLRTLGANKRGLHAIEYLLFPETDSEWEAALLEDSDAGARRRQFLASAGELVAESAAELEAAWDPAGGAYARRFSEPGGPDSVSDGVQAGLDALLNESVFLSEVVANTKLGKPLGSATGGEVDITVQESERSGASLSDMLGNLRGIRNVYFGTRDGSIGPSLSTLVRGKSPTADLHARQALEAAEHSLLSIPEPFTDALLDEPETVSAALETIKTLKRVLATEVLGTLGASLKFNDNDGD